VSRHRSLEIARILSHRSTMRIARELGIVRPTEPTEAGAVALRESLERLGTTFIKLGQLLSSRPDLVGELYAHELAHLQDDTLPMPITEARETIERSLGRTTDDLFARFDEAPLASASIAQTHTAVRADTGEAVVVKVRRPGIIDVVDQDLHVLERLTRRVDAHVDAAKLLQLRSVADELSWSLRRELDMRSDAANGIQLATTMEDVTRIHVPRVHEDLTTEEVLVMERVDGVRADDELVQRMDPEIRHELAEQLLRAYVRQVLVEGVYHADPHPGNVLVRPGEGSLVVLDFGLVGRLDDNTRMELTLVLLAMAENRAADMANLLLRMSSTTHRSDEQRFEQELRRLLPRYHRAGIAQIEVGNALVRIQQLALRCGVALPIPFALIGKTLSQVDTIARALDPTIDPLETLRAATIPLMMEQAEEMLTPSALLSIVAPRARALLELPDKAERLLDGLERGATSISITPQLDDAVAELRTITNRIVAAIVLAAMILASALLMHVEGVGTILGYPSLGFLGFVTSFALAMLLIVRMLRTEGGV
jgi:predicted unusual protein kinase regulating ubiquinone biosynthesis (AarF/ABC1/UbiB family)